MAETTNPPVLGAVQPVGGAGAADRKRRNSYEVGFPRKKYMRLISCEDTNKLDAYWMAFVFLTAQRSKSFNTKVSYAFSSILKVPNGRRARILALPRRSTNSPAFLKFSSRSALASLIRVRSSWSESATILRTKDALQCYTQRKPV